MKSLAKILFRRTATVRGDQYDRIMRERAEVLSRALGPNVCFGPESLEFPAIDAGLLNVPKFNNRLNFQSMRPSPMRGSDLPMCAPFPKIDPALLDASK